MKQLELQKEHKMKVEVEETINERQNKTANAETQMMGFYKNFLGKITDTETISLTEPKQAKPDIKERIEQKLQEIKANHKLKQEEEDRRK